MLAQQLVVTLQELRDLDIRIHPRRSLAIAADAITRKRIASSERPLVRLLKYVRFVITTSSYKTSYVAILKYVRMAITTS